MIAAILQFLSHSKWVNRYLKHSWNKRREKNIHSEQ